jgi:CrcB protein
MLSNIALVGIGGAVGSIIRFLFQRSFNWSFPYGTLTVNLMGCFAIGILWAWIAKQSLAEHHKLLLITGFCGGFTTFSAFTQEGVQMLMQNKWLQFTGYLSASVIGGFLLTYLGYKLFN